MKRNASRRCEAKAFSIRRERSNSIRSSPLSHRSAAPRWQRSRCSTRIGRGSTRRDRFSVFTNSLGTEFRTKAEPGRALSLALSNDEFALAFLGRSSRSRAKPTASKVSRRSGVGNARTAPEPPPGDPHSRRRGIGTDRPARYMDLEDGVSAASPVVPRKHVRRDRRADECQRLRDSTFDFGSGCSSLSDLRHASDTGRHQSVVRECR